MNNKSVYQEKKMKLNKINSSGNKKSVDGVHNSKSGRNADKHTNTHKVGTKKPSTVDPLPMPNDLFKIERTEDHKPPNTTTIITEEEGLKDSSQLVTGKLHCWKVILEVLVMKIPIYLLIE